MAIELDEKIIGLLEPKGYQKVQITIDEDINVSEMKPDIDRVLQCTVRLNINDGVVTNDKVSVEGELKANILYVPLNDNKPIHNIWFVAPINEVINMNNITNGDNIDIKLSLEDIRCRVINSRKLNVKAIVEIKTCADERKDLRITSDVKAQTELEKMYDTIKLCQLEQSKKESFKIKDELAIPAGKPNITELLWHDVTIQNSEMKLIEDKINLKGTLCIAALYLGENAENSLEFVENELTFNGLIDANGCNDSMIPDISVKILEDNLQIRPDLDGEERVLGVDVLTELDIKVYNEEEVSVLSDLYSLNSELDIVKQDVPYQQLLCKNQSQLTIKEAINMGEQEPDVMQVYYASGDVNVEHYDILDDSLLVEGTLFCKVMYVAADDSIPINVYETTIPFEHSINANDIKEDSIVNIRPYINQIGCAMAGERELEIRCSVNIDTTVFDKKNVPIITNIDESPLDYAKLKALPGIVGYIVKDNDNLWYIAKKYKTKVNSIKELNGIEDGIKKGDKIVVMKELINDEV